MIFESSIDFDKGVVSGSVERFNVFTHLLIKPLGLTKGIFFHMAHDHHIIIPFIGNDIIIGH